VTHPFAEEAARYYAGKFAQHGPRPEGVDWRDAESQSLRFDQLVAVCDDLDADRTILDYGCGYGALLGYLRERGAAVGYVGFELAAEMVEHAAAAFAGDPGARFTSDRAGLGTPDYVLASGVFNVKQDAAGDDWTAYVVDELRGIARLAGRGFAFNVLTSYSDPERMRPDLYYADPGFFFDLCKREFSRHVALLHDYGLWEFTVHVRREPRT
jgi:SAM-dependent methyltransferase